MFISENINQFKQLFVQKLKDMLSDEELGAFILVLANSLQDDYLRNELRQDLERNFIELKEKYLAGKLNATQDDSDVFEQLLNINMASLPVWEYESTEGWEKVYNVMRKLRPARVSAKVLETTKKSFDEGTFHFNKPFLKPEILWEGEYKKIGMRVLFNKFPFSNYHLLIVLSPEAKHSQVITESAHLVISQLARETAIIFNGFGIGFNSLAAGASVNHLHFQGFIRENKFSIEDEKWRHNGGGFGYPVNVCRFDDEELSWNFLNDLIEKDVAFNCLYRGESCYVTTRKYQGTFETPDWLAGAGWIDVAGVITVSDEKDMAMIDEHAIKKALSELVNT